MSCIGTLSGPEARQECGAARKRQNERGSWSHTKSDSGWWCCERWCFHDVQVKDPQLLVWSMGSFLRVQILPTASLRKPLTKDIRAASLSGHIGRSEGQTRLRAWFNGSHEDSHHEKRLCPCGVYLSVVSFCWWCRVLFWSQKQNHPPAFGVAHWLFWSGRK